MLTASASNRNTPDIETASDDYATRFLGRAGEFMLSVQTRAILKLLGDKSPASAPQLLDVGGGHGQVAGPLARAGWSVVVTGSSPICQKNVGCDAAGRPLPFMTCPLLDIPRPNRSVDTVISIRLLSHMEDWEALIAELCRLADRTVVIDYAAKDSLNILAAQTFGIKKAIEKNTRRYRSFWTRELKEAFRRHGFEATGAYRQFALPMAVHRILKGAAPGRWAEAALRAIGVTGLIGNPVIIRFDRVAA
jgi:2-polyprenyl-3-methyl-5-hydroxy-6-metoxy-1,4-benzoquinol methylase